jgi:hypothetical protein
MAGLKVVPVKALDDGSLDLEDLKAKAEQHKDNLAAFMACIYISVCLKFLSNSTADHLSIYFWCLRIWCSRGLAPIIIKFKLLHPTNGSLSGLPYYSRLWRTSLLGWFVLHGCFQNLFLMKC